MIFKAPSPEERRQYEIDQHLVERRREEAKKEERRQRREEERRERAKGLVEAYVRYETVHTLRPGDLVQSKPGM